jgi:hypothetical protein
MAFSSRLLALASALFFVVSMLSCGGTPTTRPAITHVYTAGFEENDAGQEIAKYWKDGQVNVLGGGTNGSYATSIAVSGTDVYVAGVEGNGTNDVAKYWKNGVAVDLTDGTQRGYSNSVFVAGTDVYVAGGEQAQLSNTLAKYWKNGIPVVLPDLGQGALAHSIFVLGNDVYVAGWQGKTTQLDPTHKLVTQVATYWKNGSPTELTDGTALSVAYSVFVSGADVYVGGFACQTLDPNCAMATYWKNGVPVQLTNKTGTTASSIFVSGTDVYVSGNKDNNIGDLWKNEMPAELTGSSAGSAANQVIFAGGHTFVGGTVINPSGVPAVTYWKDGVPVPITNGTHSATAFALAVVGS